MSAEYDLEARVLQVNSDQLLPIVQIALNQEKLRLTAWTLTPMTGGVGGGIGNTALYRFSGHCESAGPTLNWSLVLKVILYQEDAPPSSSHYWKREFDAYHSGWLNRLPTDHFAAPTCYATNVFPGEAVWLWLEDLQYADQDWDRHSLVVTARHLGQFNGVYLSQETPPDYPWLSQHWIRGDVQTASQYLPQLDHTFVTLRTVIDGNRQAQCQRLFDEREIMHRALDRLPKTIQHLDAFSGNLFSVKRPDAQKTIAIDWSFVGLESLGAELVSLFWVSLLFMTVDAAEVADYEHELFENYVDGLRDAGWSGNIDDLRLGFTAAVALRHFGTMLYLVSGYSDETGPQWWREITGSLFDAVAAQWATSGRYIDRLADEARQLIDTMAY